ncbi:MAG: ABC transporter ATP-binding protein [Spirochaetales bacterium]|nr:ABC transporter ATP-binding protein [Spirochaetales bacterium]
MADIVLKNVYKRFGDFTAVKDLNLNVFDKEFLVLLGPSGCGKTTTLRMISGLELPSEGQIILDNEDVTQKRASRRDIAFVFQLFALYPHLSVYNNISFPLKTQGIDKKQIEVEVQKIAKLLQIDHILKKKPKQLSGGDLQRVALGRGLIRKPKAMLLDEPIGTLDAKFREEMRTELKNLHIDSGSTTVYVTHDQVEAMDMGDRIAVMNHSLLQQIGEPHEVYSNPKNLFVAQFIGSPGMNFLEMESVTSDGKVLLKFTGDGTTIILPDFLEEKINNKKELSKITWGVRPEDVEIVPEGTKNSLRGAVFVIENMGNHKIIDIKLKDGTLIRVRELPKSKLRIGDNVSITFDMKMVRLFDTESGDSIVFQE